MTSVESMCMVILVICILYLLLSALFRMEVWKINFPRGSKLHNNIGVFHARLWYEKSFFSITVCARRIILFVLCSKLNYLGHYRKLFLICLLWFFLSEHVDWKCYPYARHRCSEPVATKLTQIFNILLYNVPDISIIYQIKAIWSVSYVLSFQIIERAEWSILHIFGLKPWIITKLSLVHKNLSLFYPSQGNSNQIHS